MVDGIIYRAYNKITEKSYIGQTTDSINRRIDQHYYDIFRKNRNLTYAFVNALRKYKKEDWEWTIICECERELLDRTERFFIAVYNSKKKGYNSSWGGNSPMRGRKQTESTKIKISKAMRGENNPFYGKKHTKESRKKMSESQNGHPATPSAFKKGHVPHNKGKKFSEETKKKMSDTAKNRAPRSHSEETRQKIGKSHRIFSDNIELKIQKEYESGINVKRLVMKYGGSESTTYAILKRINTGIIKNRKCSEETKIKISESKKGKKTFE